MTNKDLKPNHSNVLLFITKLCGLNTGHHSHVICHISRVCVCVSKRRCLQSTEVESRTNQSPLASSGLVWLVWDVWRKFCCTDFHSGERHIPLTEHRNQTSDYLCSALTDPVWRSQVLTHEVHLYNEIW